MSSVHCALVHHPVRDREGATVTTAVTTLDVHDIARSARTFGLAGYYIVTPIEAQHALVGRILSHWRDGAGRQRMPERHDALSLVAVRENLEQVWRDVERRDGRRPLLIATAARPQVGRATSTFAEGRRRIRESDDSFLILLGTGHGLADQVLQTADLLLEPIAGVSGYNHLSVRSAAAIIFDRLLGWREP